MYFERVGWLLALSGLGTIVVQAAAAFTVGPLPWPAAAAGGLVVGAAGTAAVYSKCRRSSRSDD